MLPSPEANSSKLPSFLSTLAAADASAPLPIEAIYTHSERLKGSSTHCLWWPSKDTPQPDNILLFITGNPGLASFYTDYLNKVYSSGTSGTLAILARSLVGHSPRVKAVELQHAGLHAQVEAVIEALDAIVETYGHEARVILAGHSIGSWIAMQATKQRRDHVSCVFLLCPTIAQMSSTPNGKRLSWLFKSPIPSVLAKLSHLLHPRTKSLLYTLFRHQWPAHQFDILWSFITSPSAVLSSLTLAHQEMINIKDLDKALLAELKPISFYLFAEADGWVGDNADDIVQELDDESSSSRIVRASDIPHSFPINHAEQVALVTLGWLSAMLDSPSDSIH